MELRVVELRLLELNLVSELRTGIGTHARRPVVLVRCETTAATGLGECEALAEPVYTSEYAAGAFAVLADELVPRLLAGGPVLAGTEEGLSRIAAVRGHRMARAGLEMALLDAELREAGRSLAERIGAARTNVHAGATIGLGSAEEVVAEVAAAIGDGYRQVKLKVVPGRAGSVLAAVRSAFPELCVSADANGTFDATRDALELAELVRTGLRALEQPCAVDDLAGSARVRAMGLPVVLDESIESLADLERAIAARACVGVSIKPARVGGLLAAVELARHCAAAGIACGLGGMLESGVGRAAALCLAARPEFSLPSDLGASARYFAPDLTAAHILRDGDLAVPNGPGIGVELDEALVAACTVEAVRIPVP